MSLKSIEIMCLFIASTSSLMSCYTGIKSLLRLFGRSLNKDENNENNENNNIIRITSIVCSIFYCMANLSSLYCMFHIYITPQTWIKQIGLASFALWVFGDNMYLLIFTYRLKFSFQNTKYSYGKCVHNTLNVMVLFYPILLLIILSLRIMYHYSCKHIQYILNTVSGSIFVFWILYNSIFSCALLFLFEKKLVQLIKSYLIAFKDFQQKHKTQSSQIDLQIEIPDNDLQMETKTHSQVSNASNVPSIPKLKRSIKQTPVNNKAENKTNRLRVKNISDSIRNNTQNSSMEIRVIRNIKQEIQNKMGGKMQTFDHTKLELIDMMTKYTLLVLLSVTTSFFVIAVAVISGRNYGHKQETDQLKTLFYYQFSINIDSYINLLCLFLHFPFASKRYQCLCSYPHKRFANCCAKCIDNKIVNDTKLLSISTL